MGAGGGGGDINIQRPPGREGHLQTPSDARDMVGDAPRTRTTPVALSPLTLLPEVKSPLLTLPPEVRTLSDLHSLRPTH